MLRAIHTFIYIMVKEHIVTIFLNFNAYYNDCIGAWGLQCFLNLEGYEADAMKFLCLVS